MPNTTEVYVNRLHDKVSEKDLEDLFSRCGEIRNVRIMTYPDGASKGFGFVSFNSSDDAEKALSLDKEVLHGQSIGVEPAKKSSRDDNAKCLHVGNLSDSVKDDDLKSFFRDFADVASAQVILDPHTKESRKFGFVYLEEGEDVDRIISKTDGKELLGSNILVMKARRNRPHESTPGFYAGKGAGRGGRFYDERERYRDYYYDNRMPYSYDSGYYYGDYERGDRYGYGGGSSSARRGSSSRYDRERPYGGYSGGYRSGGGAGYDRGYGGAAPMGYDRERESDRYDRYERSSDRRSSRR